MYILGIALTFWSAGVAQLAHTALAVLRLVPDRRIEAVTVAQSGVGGG